MRKNFRFMQPNMGPRLFYSLDLENAVKKALKKGWKVSKRRVLYKPGDVSNNWMARFILVKLDGVYIYVPHWLPARMKALELQ